MRLVAVSPDTSEVAVVRFASPRGELLGRWKGAAPPSAGTSYDVELVVPDPLPCEAFGDEVPSERYRGAAQGAFEIRGGWNQVWGVVEDLDERNVLSLRAAGGLILLEVAGAPRDELAGRAVAFVAPPFDVYPTGA